MGGYKYWSGHCCGKPMADVEAASADQFTITVMDQLNIQAEAPSQPSGTPHHKAVFKAGLFVTLISIAGILHPPISAATSVNTTHAFLSQTLHFMVCAVSLAIGVLQMLLSITLHRKPRLLNIMAKPLTEIGWGLLSIALGYGSALVLMVSSPPWFVLFLVFLSVSLK